MQRVGAGLAVLLLLGSGVLTLLRFTATGSRWPSMLASFSTYALVGYLLSVVAVLLLLRVPDVRRLAAGGLVLALVGTGLHVAWLAPSFTGTTGRTTDLTVMNANLQFGEADPRAVLRGVRAHHVDVLVVEELTPEELDRFGAIRDALPHTAGAAAPSAAGTMVFSRFPLSDEERLEISNGGLAVTVGAPTPFRLIAAHPSQPVIAAAKWNADLVRLRALARSAVADGPTLVVGDLNATTDHRQLRRILGVGLRDAAEQANAGWQPTWPDVSRIPFPRLIAIDHVLTSRQLAAVRTTTVSLPGSDHRGLVARLDVS